MKMINKLLSEDKQRDLYYKLREKFEKKEIKIYGNHLCLSNYKIKLKDNIINKYKLFSLFKLSNEYNTKEWSFDLNTHCYLYEYNEKHFICFRNDYTLPLPLTKNDFDEIIELLYNYYFEL